MRHFLRQNILLSTLFIGKNLIYKFIFRDATAHYLILFLNKLSASISLIQPSNPFPLLTMPRSLIHVERGEGDTSARLRQTRLRCEYVHGQVQRRSGQHNGAGLMTHPVQHARHLPVQREPDGLLTSYGVDTADHKTLYC